MIDPGRRAIKRARAADRRTIELHLRRARLAAGEPVTEADVQSAAAAAAVSALHSALTEAHLEWVRSDAVRLHEDVAHEAVLADDHAAASRPLQAADAVRWVVDGGPWVTRTDNPN